MAKQPQREELYDFSFEIAFLEGIYRRDENDPRVIERLATLYTEAGLYEKGLELDQRNIALQPANPGSHYDLACSLSLCGRVKEAAAMLKQALELGFANYAWARRDPDLAALRESGWWLAIDTAMPADEESVDMEPGEDDDDADLAFEDDAADSCDDEESVFDDEDNEAPQIELEFSAEDLDENETKQFEEQLNLAFEELGLGDVDPDDEDDDSDEADEGKRKK
jgi:tetratricopeptide (TPR) repeat protein